MRLLLGKKNHRTARKNMLPFQSWRWSPGLENSMLKVPLPVEMPGRVSHGWANSPVYCSVNVAPEIF
jgi:hypothetical protein